MPLNVPPAAVHLGGCFNNLVEVAGKQKFGFDIGDQLQVKYKAAQPDKGFKRFVGSNFKCSLLSDPILRAEVDKGP